jgi:hypothetical protein
MAQANATLSLDLALQIVKAAGYRVSKPKPKLRSRGPTCVVRFADGELCRMTTHCRDDALDWKRGIKLCKAAWCSRTRRAEAPPIISAHFERDGEVLGLQEAA